VATRSEGPPATGSPAVGDRASRPPTRPRPGEAVGAEHVLRALDEQGQLALQHEVDLLLSTAGNLLQRTRCVYFQDVTTPCNKREQGGS
jgi:hypothetical protein